MGLALKVRRLRRSSTFGIVAAFLLVGSIAARGQAARGGSVESRTAGMSRILSEYQDEERKLEPEAASLTGDKRYDDQLSDLSASAANARLSRGQIYIQRLSEIDTGGLPEKTRVAAEGLLNRLIEEQASDRGKTWQRPLEQWTRLNEQLLSIAAKLPFDNVKDYDDYVARLKKIPNAFSQIMTNLQLGSEAGRVPPRAEIAKVLEQIRAISSQTAETSAFAAPLKRFPTAIAAGDRKRIAADVLDAITTAVLPSYERVARFIAAHGGAASAIEPALPQPGA